MKRWTYFDARKFNLSVRISELTFKFPNDVSTKKVNQVSNKRSVSHTCKNEPRVVTYERISGPHKQVRWLWKGHKSHVTWRQFSHLYQENVSQIDSEQRTQFELLPWRYDADRSHARGW